MPLACSHPGGCASPAPCPALLPVPQVCIIGAGKMSKLLVKHMHSKGCTRMTVLNRSLPRAEVRWAEQLGQRLPRRLGGMRQSWPAARLPTTAQRCLLLPLTRLPYLPPPALLQALAEEFPEVQFDIHLMHDLMKVGCWAPCLWLAGSPSNQGCCGKSTQVQQQRLLFVSPVWPSHG